jgi:hypothetical protein
MQVNGVVYADASQDVDIPMDLPLSLMTPGNTAVDATQASVSLAPARTYAAYPPLFVAIKSATGLLAFAEVEERPERGTVGLRGLSVFAKSKLHHELGGGAEIPPGWELDINVLGICRAPQRAVETTHAGHGTFPYAGSVWPPILSQNPASLHVIPGPAFFTEADYDKYVLNNRGVHRCQAPTGCMDVTYKVSSSSAHTLDATNGATLALIAPGAAVLGAQVTRSRPLRLPAGQPGDPSSTGLEPVALPAPAGLPPARAVAALPGASAAIIANLDPDVSKRLLAAARALSGARTGNFAALQHMPMALSGSVGPTESNAVTRDFSLVAESPEEESTLNVPLAEGGGLAPHSPNAGCVINSAQNAVTRAPSACMACPPRAPLALP